MATQSQNQSAAGTSQNPARIVYVVSQFGHIVGVYEDFQDATQVANVAIQKGWLAKIEPFNIIAKNSLRHG